MGACAPWQLAQPANLHAACALPATPVQAAAGPTWEKVFLSILAGERFFFFLASWACSRPTWASSCSSRTSCSLRSAASSILRLATCGEEAGGAGKGGGQREQRGWAAGEEAPHKGRGGGCSRKGRHPTHPPTQPPTHPPPHPPTLMLSVFISSSRAAMASALNFAVLSSPTSLRSRSFSCGGGGGGWRAGKDMDAGGGEQGAVSGGGGGG